MRIINDCVLEISITGLSFLKHFIIVLIPPLSWLFIVNFQGKQFTASAIFLRCTSARLTILIKDYNNQSRLITVVLPKRVFMVRTASCIHYHLPEKTQRLLCMACPCLSRHLFRMVCCFSSRLIPLESVSFIRKRPLELISKGLIKELGKDCCNENTTLLYLYDKKTRLP